MSRLKNIRQIYRQLMKILSKNNKKWFIVLFILSVIGAIVETLGVSIMLPLVQVMLDPEKLLRIDLVNLVYKSIGMNSTQDLITFVACGVVLVYIIKNVYLTFLSYARVKYSTKVQRELSIKMLNSYMSRGYSFFRVNNTSTLLRGINGSVSGVYNVIYLFMRILAEILTIVGVFAYVIMSEWKMALVMAGLIGSCLFMVSSLFKVMMQRAGKEYHYYVERVNKWSLQLFSGIKEILVLDRKKYFTENYEKAYIGQQSGTIKQAIAGEIPAYVIEGICVTGMIVAVWWKIGTIQNPVDFIPQLAAFAMAAFRLLPSLGRISSYFNGCIFHLPAVEEVYNNIKEAEEYKSDTIVTIDENEEIIFERELLIRDVVWRYPDGKENILDHISLTIKKGEAVAFVGPSGAGKSTLADILLGLFQPQEGGIFIDDINILGKRKAISKLVGFVPQAVYLIDDTIRRNIAFGIYDEDISDEEIWRALEQAQMKEMVEKLPLGLDTVVGERGVRFSGGQAQRLAIARALYTDPSILVLDEATSALDSETESAVMDAINALQGKITLIIIAHRLTTIRNCNKIYEINNGKAFEKKYDELT